MDRPSRKQRTLAQPVTFSGVGLHSGQSITVVIQPAPTGGVAFVDTTLEYPPRIKACPESIFDSTRNTTIGDDRSHIQTVEHLLAPLWVHGIDHALVQITGSEPPAMDGSALEYAQAIHAAGVRELEAEVEPIVLTEPVMVKLGRDRAWAVPHNGFRVTYVLDYSHPMVGAQVLDMEVTPESFRSGLAPSRTFALESEVKALFDSGLAKGGSLENAVVVYEKSYSSLLRFPDEFARHKALDLVGDLALLGRPLLAHVVSIRGGHRLNAELVNAIWELFKSS